MQVVIWIIIILVAIFLIWLLRKWIKRIIFIAILLALAFFIYGIFSPSGASRLWYNVRTFPQRITSWVSNQTFLDYDSYKKDISSVWAKIDETIDSNVVTPIVEDKNKWSDKEVKNEVKDESKKDNKKDDKVETVKPTTEKSTKKTNSNNKWYSSDEVLAVINKYVKENLDDDTDILVRIDYDDSNSPERIMLQTQKKDTNAHYVSIPRLSIKKVTNWLQHSKSSIVTVISNDKAAENKVEQEVVSTKEIEDTTSKKVTVSENRSHNWLTQAEMKEAEQIFSILF